MYILNISMYEIIPIMDNKHNTDNTELVKYSKTVST